MRTSDVVAYSKGKWILSLFVASSMGLGMGWAASHLLRLMSRRDADTLIRNDDLVGKEGMVTLRLMQEERDLVESLKRSGSDAKRLSYCRILNHSLR